MRSRKPARRSLPLFDGCSTGVPSIICPNQGQRVERMLRRVPHILLVDDDRATLCAMSETLKLRLGDEVHVETADSTSAALVLLRTVKPDVIVSDILMPGPDGVALLKEATDTYPDVPIILVTGLGSEREEEALYGGAFAYLQKPLDVDRFMSVVRAALDRMDLDRRVKERNRASRLNLIDSVDAATEQVL